ncbi:sensor histidine kinase efflux regulator BaeS [Silvimonas amylolytica]|uniref:histidine kinase n=1 Tax=Silvimonas amylolytica TaxID=449663 RepID=A0ABQ2PS83_9NEIS|nr:sensor histidine kinase efflux regulator BaeS [Silvimonas amylolytica]GGP28134.1 two-component sensor histidine kinase [Silvimonas amylolytica]
MKPGLTAKLFIAILASCAVVLLVNGVLGRISFERGFLGYLNDQGLERMRAVVPRLEAAYGQHGNWDFLHNNMQGWFDFMRPSPGEWHMKESPPISDQTGAVPRFALLDQNYHLVIGNPDASRQSILLPVVVQGRNVGWMALVPFQQAIAAGDVRFFNAQLQLWWQIGLFSVIVAALLAGWLARTLLRRLYGLTTATHQLATGNYKTRVVDDSRDEVGGLARDFNQLAQALEHTERSRRNFMADISHELRTPLAVMRAEVEAMQDGIRPMSAETLQSVASQIRQLGKLVDDLHDLSLTDVGALTYRREQLDIRTLLESTLVPLQGRFTKAGLALTWQLDFDIGLIYGDERRLQQLFTNLLENALRYTDASGAVKVHGWVEKNRLIVTIDDSAPGVDPQKLPRLFERFYRAETSRNRNSGGSGLGLAICRNIVEAHDGQIDAQASDLGGLRVTVALPEAA